ncbi:MAG: DUF4145 domain-containing protein [Gammaproteobacteria bacterium]|nr:DUF4145 domain-containing protein [Gammaproteobacteria bacterium]MBU1477730.1 DUF4145 domain-containing protein [Gammaproteobacteria bacterium]MBU2001061.1 DUF4145 domain-containing protein [Gammaproteobacteria bacterium]MBU2132383.1 DUF4145 domain-containing protein [Gammaproteobacteria bacterium]MBU2189476.1 DUF4145 domain-containing protein [Gammaproteobacteria bacterium]
MSKPEYFPPVLGKGEYHCPHCNVYAKQFYAHLHAAYNSAQYCNIIGQQTSFSGHLARDWIVTKCQRCAKVVVWQGDNMIYPRKMIAPLPNSDMNDQIKADYIEAGSVFSDSPRAAAALLRLALQKLCIQLGEKGENINEDIKKLVAKGLNPLVQKSLDALRITGNNAVHPGEINLEEEPEKVLKLFELLNFIANKMITEPREIEHFYAALPEGALEAVKKRDGKG